MTETRPRRPHGALFAQVGMAMLIVGCGGTPLTTAGPTASPLVATPLPTATPRPTVAPTEEPIATLEATVERATEAPPGAIEILMTTVNTPQFQPNEITAPAGTITFFLHNSGALGHLHDFQIGQELLHPQALVQGVLPNQSVALTLADVPAGTYEFWCSIAKHYSFGMVGTLTVTP